MLCDTCFPCKPFGHSKQCTSTLEHLLYAYRPLETRNSQWDLLDWEAPQQHLGSKLPAGSTQHTSGQQRGASVPFKAKLPTAITHHLFLEALLTITDRHFLYWWGNWLLCCGRCCLVSSLQKGFWVGMSGFGGSPWLLSSPPFVVLGGFIEC